MSLTVIFSFFSGELQFFFWCVVLFGHFWCARGRRISSHVSLLWGLLCFVHLIWCLNNLLHWMLLVMTPNQLLTKLIISQNTNRILIKPQQCTTSLLISSTQSLLVLLPLSLSISSLCRHIAFNNDTLWTGHCLSSHKPTSPTHPDILNNYLCCLATIG